MRQKVPLLFYCFFFFFFNDTATTEIYTLSLHDALPISAGQGFCEAHELSAGQVFAEDLAGGWRSEEHTSELQSRLHLVCRLLLEKKKKTLKEYESLERKQKYIRTARLRRRTSDINRCTL